jgi:hypothetical protein
LLQVPQTEEYPFPLTTGGGAVLRLYGATVTDADKSYTAGTSATANIHLEKRHHPVNLVYARGQKAHPFWSCSGADPAFPVKQ